MGGWGVSLGGFQSQGQVRIEGEWEKGLKLSERVVGREILGGLREVVVEGWFVRLKEWGMAVDAICRIVSILVGGSVDRRFCVGVEVGE